MTTEEASQGQADRDSERMYAEAFEGVLGAGGLIAAGAGRHGKKAHQGGQQMLIVPDQKSGQNTECAVNFDERVDHRIFWGILIAVIS